MFKYATAITVLALSFIVTASGQNVTTDVGSAGAPAANLTVDAGNLDADLASNDTKPAGTVSGTDVGVSDGSATSVAPPATETTVAPMTTVAPTMHSPKLDVSAPDAISYVLQSTTAGKYCILVTSAVQFTILYPAVNHTTLSTTFNAGGNHSVIPEISVCGNGTVPANLGIKYAAGFQVLYSFSVMPKEANKYGLVEMTILFNFNESDLFPGSNPSDTSIHILTIALNDTFVVAKDHSYRCDVDKTVELEAVLPQDKINGTATIGSFKFAAFGQFDKDEYGEAEECSDDFTTSDIVPIAVGCALAALVVIVLIAYLIGRRRSRQKGYQSV